MTSNIAVLGSINMDIAVKLSNIPREGDVVYSTDFKIGLGGKASQTESFNINMRPQLQHLLAFL